MRSLPYAVLLRGLAAVAAAAALALAPLPASAGDKKAEQQQPPPDLTQPVTLDRAINIALQNHQSIGIAQSQISASKAGVTRAMSSYYPSIAPSYQYSSQLTTQTFNGVRQTGTVSQSITSIGANQLIFDMGKREENVLASKYAVKSSEYNLLDTREGVILNVTTAYYDLLRTRELLKVAQSSVGRAQTTLDSTKAFAEEGTGPRKDILQAQADLDNAQVQLLQAQNNVRLQMTTLKNAMGLLTMTPINVPETQIPAPETAPDKTPVETYVKTALDQRPDLKQAGANIDVNRHDLKIADINAGFQVQASVTEGYRIDPDPGENRNFVTSFSYPLFDAGLTRAQVRQAKAALDQSRRQLELSRQAAQLDVEQSYLTREQSRANVSATEAAVRAAQENYDAATAARKEGAGTILDIITAQNQLVVAQTNAVQAIFDYYTADARLKRATGENDPYLARAGGNNR